MRKTFLKVSLLGALAFSMPLAITSCKDYDDDIEVLNQETGDLKTQLSALESALATAESEAAAAAQAAAEAKAAAVAAADAAKNAQATGDTALAEAKNAAAATAAAQTEAQLAKQAAADAKAEAIAEAKAYCDQLMAKAATKEELNTLASQVSGIEASLNKLSTELTGEINELKKFETAAKTQIAALEKFQAEATKQLSELATKVSGIQTTVDGLTTSVTDLKTRVSDLESKASSILNELNTIKGNIEALQKADKDTQSDISQIKTDLSTASNNISKLNNSLNTVISVLTSRLSSLDFIPASYVDGIPAIDFSALTYTPLKQVSGTDKYTADGKAVTTAAAATASFYVHPVTVTKNDIDVKNISLIHKTATSRSTALTSVDNANITLVDGILNIPVIKDATSDVTENSDGTINIVSFKVPVPKTEGVDEEQPIVYSEFIRLAEQDPFTVEIANAKDKTNHLLSYAEVKATTPLKAGDNANAEKTLFYCKWDGSLNLAEKIDGCKVVDGKCKAIMNEEALAVYGLKLKYEVYGEKFIDDKDGVTNQQEFVKVSEDGVVSVNEKFSGVKENVIGRTPIIKVMLLDTKNNNNVVDVAYVAVKFTAHEMSDIVINTVDNAIAIGEDWLPVNATTAPDGTKLGDAEFAMTWTQINKDIYANYGSTGISHEDFAKIYKQGDWKVVKTISYKVDGTTVEAKPNAKIGTMNLNFLNPDYVASSESLDWTMTEDDVKELLPYVKRDYIAEVRVTNADGLYADAVFYVKATVKLTLPTAGVKSDINWYNGVYRLEPVIYDSSMVEGTTVSYHNDIFAGYVKNNLINPGMPYGKWDIQFTKAQPVSGFTSASTTVPNTSDAQTTGYLLAKNGTNAAQLAWNSGHEAWTTGTFAFNASNQNAYFTLYTSAVGKELVDNANATATYLNPAGKQVKIASWVKMNKYNIYQVEEITMQVVRPINIATTTADKFYDGVINGSYISTANLLGITDFHGYKVANEADNAAAANEKDRYTQSLWNYYGIENIEFIYNDPYLVENGTATTKKMKDYYPKASISTVGNTAEGQGQLVFNNPDSKVEKAFVVRIPVNVTYKFGTITSYVDVTVIPAQ